MERDPVRLAWRAARGQHLLVFAGVLAVFPIAWFAIDLPRQMVEHLLADPGARSPLLEIAYEWPLFSRDPDRIVVFPGFDLPVQLFALTVLGLIAALFLLRAVLLAVADRITGHATDALIADELNGLMRRLLEARTVAGLDPSEMMRQATGDLASMRSFLVQAVTAPVFAGARIALAVAYATWLDWRLGGVVLAAALVMTGLARWRRLSDAARRQADEARIAALVLAQDRIVARWPAIRSFGSIDQELAAFKQTTLPHSSALEPAVARRLRDGVIDVAPLLAPALVPLLLVGVVGAVAVSTACALAVALALLPGPVRTLARWRDERATSQRALGRLSEVSGALHARREPDGVAVGGERPGGAGPALALDALVAVDQVSSIGAGPVTFRTEAPAHVALLSTGDQEADILAETLAGIALPASGTVLVAGVDPAALPAAARARSIAFASAHPVVEPSRSWFDNLTYGLPPNARSALDDGTMGRVLSAVGLDRVIDARALGAPVDPAVHPELAAAVMPARAAVMQRLETEALADLVERFDPGRYNAYATVAENILFGVPVGDTFDAAHLAGHPFFRAVLEAESLSGPLMDMGLSIATTVTEMFAGIPDGHPLFTRFAFMAASERQNYEDLVARRSLRRRGEGAARDRDRLVSLALRYIETRHRLGLVDERLEARLLSARRTFANLLPPALKPAIDFYDPNSLCRAATFADNLLFGRIAYDVAGAEARVGATVRQVITEQGLGPAVTRLGLSTTIEGPGGVRADISRAVDLGRNLLREPAILIAGRPDAGLDRIEAHQRLAALRGALTSRTLVAVLGPDMDPDGFDHVVRVPAVVGAA